MSEFGPNHVTLLILIALLHDGLINIADFFLNDVVNDVEST